jgi:hypothetical protein
MGKTIVNYDITQLNTALVDTLQTASGIKVGQDLDQITEQIPNADMPLIQVYPESWSSPSDSDTNVNTFGGGGFGSSPVIQRLPITFNCDVYVTQINIVAVMMPLYAITAQAINEVLAAQTLKPLFGHPAIQAFTWEGERAVFQYSEVSYLGIRYTIDLEIF